MHAANRDRDMIEHMLRYCQQVQTAHRDFNSDKDVFLHSTTYQNAIAMCILQIGELVNRLTAEFQRSNSTIPWHQIRGMRNYVAHEYGAIDLEVVWFVATHSIDELQSFCEQYLASNT